MQQRLARKLKMGEGKTLLDTGLSCSGESVKGMVER
jgi:hypothetical protein